MLRTRELLIVGAGPAGVSAALWARSLNLDFELLEAEPLPGGQLRQVHFHPRELPGTLQGDGVAIADSYARQLTESVVPVRYGVRVVSLTPGPAPSLSLEGGESLGARTLLLCCGARKRRLGVPGEEEYRGRGVSDSATRDLPLLSGRRVMVVGGGDAALENALLLLGAGCDVTVLARAGVRARAEFRDRVMTNDRVRVLQGMQVLAVLGDGERVRGVRVAGPEGEGELACDAVVVKIGVLPNTEWCRGVLDHDADGYLRVDPGQRTSAEDVWAAGDITRPLLPSVPVAAGQGALAVAAIRRMLRGD